MSSAPVKNAHLSAAKKAKNDEFYTQYHDIEKEMSAYLDFNENVFRNKTVLLPCDDPEWSHFTKFFAQNFTRLGLKKLISTSFAHEAKRLETPYQPSLFESMAAGYDAKKSVQRGKIFTLSQDSNADGVVDVHDLQWRYLQGDGDFRSDEIKQLRDEADIIITNPPFSLFREFMAWIMEAGKQFAIIGNKNAITYKEVFPLIKNNRVWSGAMSMGVDILFHIPKDLQLDFIENKKAGSTYRIVGDEVMARASGMWFTNLDHGRRHQPLQLMTMDDNRKFNKQVINNPNAYQPYDNYNAIEVPFTNAIPSDFDGVMGVPISFLDKYCPEQFEILGITDRQNTSGIRTKKYTLEDSPKFNDLNARSVLLVDGKYTQVYARILIRHKGA